MKNFIRQTSFRRVMAGLLALVFVFQSTGATLWAQTIPGLQAVPVIELPQLKGLVLNRKDPFQLAFILGGGKAVDTDTGRRLAGYFLASLAVPEKDTWVNLSAFEKDRMIPQALGTTPLGQDMLAQDYVLKQLTASLTNPDTTHGRLFWDKVYAEAYKQFGTTDVPVDLINKVWIVPAKAVVFRKGNSVTVVESKLQVKTETDYLAVPAATPAQEISTRILREIIIPIIEKDVNTDAQFAQLRQIYNAMILAAWYKKNLRRTILGEAYADQEAVDGVLSSDQQAKERIYQSYLESFKKGAYNFIREEKDAVTGDAVPRKYFSGGLYGVSQSQVVEKTDRAALTPADAAALPVAGDQLMKVKFQADAAEEAAQVIGKKRGARGNLVKAWAEKHRGQKITETLEELGERFGGLTRQRVQQILSEGDYQIELSAESGRPPETEGAKRLKIWAEENRGKKVEEALTDLGDRFDLSTTHVRKILIDGGYGIETRGEQETEAARDLKAWAEANRGRKVVETQDVLADRFKLSRGHVARLLAEGGYEIQTGSFRESDPVKLKVIAEGIARLKSWAEENRGKKVEETQAELGRQFGVSSANVALILSHGGYQIITGGNETKGIREFKAWAEQNRGKTFAETQETLGKRFGLSHDSVRNVLSAGKYRIKTRGPGNWKKKAAEALKARVEEQLKQILKREDGRPDPLDIAAMIRRGWSERDIDRLAMLQGYSFITMDKTLHDVDSLVPYVIEINEKLNELYGKDAKNMLLFAGRDAENLYDAYVVMAKMRGWKLKAKLFPGSRDFWQLKQPDAFFQYMGMTKEAFERGERFVVVDSGFRGSIGEALREQLVLRYAAMPSVEARIERQVDIRLVKASEEADRRQIILDWKDPSVPKQQLFSRVPASISGTDDIATWVATALQLLPRFHQAYRKFDPVAKKFDFWVWPESSSRPKYLENDVSAVNEDVINVHAALRVQHHLLKAIMASESQRQDRAEASFPAFEDMYGPNKNAVLVLTATNPKDDNAALKLFIEGSDVRIVINGKRTGGLFFTPGRRDFFYISAFDDPGVPLGKGYGQLIVTMLARVASHYHMSMQNVGTHNVALIKAYANVFADEVLGDDGWQKIDRTAIYDEKYVDHVLFSIGRTGGCSLKLGHIKDDWYEVLASTTFEKGVPDAVGSNVRINSEGKIVEVEGTNEQVKGMTGWVVDSLWGYFLESKTVLVRGWPKESSLPVDVRFIPRIEGSLKAYVSEQLGSRDSAQDIFEGDHIIDDWELAELRDQFKAIRARLWDLFLYTMDNKPQGEAVVQWQEVVGGIKADVKVIRDGLAQVTFRLKDEQESSVRKELSDTLALADEKIGVLEHFIAMWNEPDVDRAEGADLRGEMLGTLKTLTASMGALRALFHKADSHYDGIGHMFYKGLYSAKTVLDMLGYDLPGRDRKVEYYKIAGQLNAVESAFDLWFPVNAAGEFDQGKLLSESRRRLDALVKKFEDKSRIPPGNETSGLHDTWHGIEGILAHQGYPAEVFEQLKEFRAAFLRAKPELDKKLRQMAAEEGIQMTDPAALPVGGIDLSSLGFTVSESGALDLDWPAFQPGSAPALNQLTPVITGFTPVESLPGLVR